MKSVVEEAGGSDCTSSSVAITCQRPSTVCCISPTVLARLVQQRKWCHFRDDGAPTQILFSGRICFKAF